MIYKYVHITTAMHMRYTHITATPVLIMVAHCALAADTHTVFDMQLQAPFTVPECSYTRIGKSGGYYNPPANGAYYELLGDGIKGKHSFIANDIVQINWSSVPKPVSVNALATVIDGHFEGIVFNTLGMLSQSRDMQILTDKFAAATKVDHPTMQNGYGAQFTAIRAQWDLGEISVSFDSATSADHGLIRIETIKSSEDRKAKLAAYEHKGPSL
jgi:hypothetical protein